MEERSPILKSAWDLTHLLNIKAVSLERILSAYTQRCLQSTDTSSMHLSSCITGYLWHETINFISPARQTANELKAQKDTFLGVSAAKDSMLQDLQIQVLPDIF